MSVFDVLREKLEEEPIADIQQGSDYLIQGNAIPKRRVIKIVNQVEQEYNDGWILCSGCKDCQHKEHKNYGKV